MPLVLACQARSFCLTSCTIVPSRPTQKWALACEAGLHSQSIEGCIQPSIVWIVTPLGAPRGQPFVKFFDHCCLSVGFLIPTAGLLLQIVALAPGAVADRGHVGLLDLLVGRALVL
jgi:hypothetical protein